MDAARGIRQVYHHRSSSTTTAKTGMAGANHHHMCTTTSVVVLEEDEYNTARTHRYKVIEYRQVTKWSSSRRDLS